MTEQNLQQLNDNIQVQRYVFHEDSTVKQGLEKMFKTGIQNVSTDGITCAGKIDVKSPLDKKDCINNGIADMTSSCMIITDYNNQCIKLISVDEGTIISKRSLSSAPFDVTVIPGARVAVTVQGLHQLQFFTTDTDLTPCGHIAVDGECICIESTGNRLVVGYRNHSKVQIMDLVGQFLKSFTTDFSGNPLFGVPRYLSLNLDHTSIFISDWENNTVTRMSTDGMIEWVYMDKDLKYPLGVTTGPDGCLYICSCNTHSLHVVSAAGVRQKIVPVDQFQMNCPWAICYSQDQDALTVTSVNPYPAQRNFIRRFNLH